MTLKFLFQNQLIEQEESWFRGFLKNKFIDGLIRIKDKDDAEIIKYYTAPDEYFKKTRIHPIFTANITFNKETGIWSTNI